MTESSPDFTTLLVLAGVGLFFLVGLCLGLLGILKGVKSETGTQGSDTDGSEEDDDDDITAPIVPAINVARSPHDRHRDLVLGQALIKDIDLLDSMISNHEKRGEKETAKQLEMLKEDFLDILQECHIKEFDYKTNTIVDQDTRSLIQIVDGKARGERTKIAKTIRSGFLLSPPGEDPYVVRKAEVKIK